MARQMVNSPYGRPHDEIATCAAVGCTPVQPEPTPSIDGEMFVPNPVVREYRQMRLALENLVSASDDFDHDPELAEALGFARGILALVQPVDPSELD